MTRKTACNRCGNCCRQGGPALHTEDRDLLRRGVLACDDLITIRRGELALAPLSGDPVRVEKEFIKIQGQQGRWCCRFFDDVTNQCRIYDHRPLACRVLECTAPGPLLALAGRDLLDRFHCGWPREPGLLALMRQQETLCPCPDLEKLPQQLVRQREKHLHHLTSLVNLDLRIRHQAVRQFRLTLAQELFALGRPLFQVLRPLGIETRQHAGGGLRLYLAQPHSRTSLSLHNQSNHAYHPK